MTWPPWACACWRPPPACGRVASRWAGEHAADAEAGGTVDELRNREDQLRHPAFHDPLTGLANRALFQDRADHAIARQLRNPRPVGVLYIDLDGFKPVNDELGHATGDALLVAVGRRLSGCVRPSDTVARPGGDEFAVLLEPIESQLDAVALAERIVALFADPFPIDGQEIRVSASVGLAVHTAHNQVGELLRNADIAMYAAKVQGKGRYVAFQPKMRMGIAAPAV